MDLPRRSTAAVVGRSAVTSAFIVATYYLVPVEPGVTGAQLALRACGTVVTGALVTWLIVRQVSRQLVDSARSSLVGLLNALVGGVAFFALADYVTAVSGRGQF